MMRSTRRWLKRFETFLHLEILEERTPVSEGMSTLMNMAALAAAGRALALTLQPPPSEHLAPITRSEVVTTNAPRSSGDFSPASGRGISSPSFRPTPQAPANASTRPTVNPLPDPVGASFDNADIALFDSLALAQPSTQAPAAFGNSLDVAPMTSSAGADWGQQPSAAPDAGLSDRGSESSSINVAPVAANAPPDAATLALMLGAGLGTSGQPAQAVAAGTLAAGTNGNGGSSGSGGPLVNSQHHGRPRDKHGDPLWVLDAYDRIVLPDAGTVPLGYAINTFAGWAMSLDAQVSGATVQSYSWTFGGNLSDFTSVTGQNSYNLQFIWRAFSGNNDSDTVTLTTTNVGGGGDTQTFNFNVISTSNKANQGSRPTAIPSFPLVIPPDAVKPGQEMIRQQYYSLSEETGEVQTSFSLPSYNPGITPLQLDYSSLAANPLPIFTELYQLTQPIQPNSTVTATLKLNGVSQGTFTYNTSLLNPGDILDIALQANAAGLSTNRYGYEIDVTENGIPQTPQTGSVDIVNLAGSAFGAGWSLDNVDQVFPVTGGVILAMPYGQSLWFANGGNCGPSGTTSFVTPAGDFSCLVQNNSDQSYTLTAKDGVKINFNSSGYQTAIVEPTTNDTFTFSYNPSIQGQLVSITDFENRVITLAYNGSGRVKTITDPDLVAPSTYRTVTLGYDLHHTQLTSITGPDPGNMETIPSFQYSYDTAGDLLTLTDPRSDLPNNDMFTFAYNFADRIDTVTRPDTLPGGAHTTESLFAQQMNGLQDPNNPDPTPVLAVQAAADYSDPRSTQQTPIDWLVATDWFGDGYGLQYYDPLNDLTTNRRDPNGLTWLDEDPLSRPTRTFYDQMGKIALPAPQGDPTEIVLPDANTELYTYNTFNEPLTYTDPDGYTATYGYGGTSGTDDASGSLLTDAKCPCSVSTGYNPQPGEYQQSWNLRGYKKTITDPNNNTVAMTHGTNDTLTGIQYPPDATGGTSPMVTMTYNSAGDLLTYEDALAYTTSHLPDNLGRVLNQMAPTGGEISYTYDAAGNVTSVEDPVLNLTSYHYDPMNRVDWMVAPGNLTTSYTRDADGNVTDVTDPDILLDNNHRDRHFIYDNAGRLITEQWLDGSTITYQANYSYDAASEPLTASDQTGSGAIISAYTFTYDVRGRLTSTQEDYVPGVDSVTLTDQYDPNGNRTSLADNLPQSGAIAYTYDPGNRLATEKMTVAGAREQPSITFQYDSQDPADRLTGIQRSASATNWANTAIGYTNRSLVSSIQDTYPNGGAVSFNYTYDADAQVHTYSGPDGGMSYGYDPTGQLTAVYGSHPESYAYDLSGNRQSANGNTYGTPGPANQLTSDGVYAYTYDNVGNLLTKTGLEGGITTVYSFTWDFRNRLMEVKKTQNGGSTVLADDQFTYDVFDRRIKKTTMDGSQLWTVYDGVNPYADFSGKTSLALATRYVYGNGIDQLLASTDANGNNTVWYLTDLTGSVRKVVADSGMVKATLTYDSFGNIIAGTSYNRFAYTGREWDSEIGLYYYRARYYDPATGRFISRDLLGFGASGANLYRYVANSPANGTDPSGEVILWGAILVGALAIGALGLFPGGAQAPAPGQGPVPTPPVDPGGGGVLFGAGLVLSCASELVAAGIEAAFDWLTQDPAIPVNPGKPFNPADAGPDGIIRGVDPNTLNIGPPVNPLKPPVPKVVEVLPDGTIWDGRTWADYAIRRGLPVDIRIIGQ